MAAAIKQRYNITGSASKLVTLTTIEQQAQAVQQAVQPSTTSSSSHGLDSPHFSAFVSAEDNGSSRPAHYLSAAKGGPAFGGGIQSSSEIPRVDWEDDLRPPSAGQAQMYVLSMQGSNSHYNECSLYTIVGQLDLEMLQKALNAMTMRHGELLMCSLRRLGLSIVVWAFLCGICTIFIVPLMLV
jgi:hypothetical protein